MNLNGELTPEQYQDFDALMLKLKGLNSNFKPRQSVKYSDIKPLPEQENVRLWEYLLHISQIVVLSKKCFPIIRKIVTKDNSVTMDDVVQEAKMDVALFLYKNLWRNYKTDPSGKPNLAFKDAYWGFVEWKHPYLLRLNLIKLVDLKNDTALDGPQYAEKTPIRGSGD